MPGPDRDERERVLELINAEFNNRIQQQATAGSAVDTKTTLIVGFVVVAVQILLTQKRAEPWSALAFLAFGVAFVAGVWVIRLRKYKTVPRPSEVVNFYTAHSGEDGHENLREHVLSKLVATKVVAIDRNGALDKEKVIGWWVAVVAFGMAVVFSATSVLEAPSDKQQHTRQRRHNAAAAAAAPAPARASDARG